MRAWLRADIDGCGDIYAALVCAVTQHWVVGRVFVLCIIHSCVFLALALG